MSFGDALEIVLVAAGCAIAVGLIALALAWWTRRWSVRWQFALVATGAVLGSYAGALAIARLMFLSPHDLTVLTVVSTVAAVVAIVVALVVGLAITRWSAGMRAQVRDLAAGRVGDSTGSGPLELRRVSTELAETQRLLDDAHKRGQRLEESRRELVSWVSHDLRTPLAGLRAMAEALEDGMVEEPSRYLRRIRGEVDRMATMVDDLFELSRINAGVLKLAPEPVLVADLVSEAIAGADPIARARNVHLGGLVSDGLEITADPAGLSRVVSNLLINAIRHTPADGVVEIAGRAAGDAVELSVSDGCGGLTDDEIERVFDLGWQRNRARTPAPGDIPHGAGLGLAVVKGIVEAHRGQVSVENLETSGGCRFSVLLPA